LSLSAHRGKRDNIPITVTVPTPTPSSEDGAFALTTGGSSAPEPQLGVVEDTVGSARKTVFKQLPGRIGSGLLP